MTETRRRLFSVFAFALLAGPLSWAQQRLNAPIDMSQETLIPVDPPGELFSVWIPDDQSAGRRLRIPPDLELRLGIYGYPLTHQLSDFFEISSGSGLLIREVLDGGIANLLGLRAGDVLLSAAGVEIKTILDLRRVLSAGEPVPEADNILLQFQRAGQHCQATVPRSALAPAAFHRIPESWRARIRKDQGRFGRWMPLASAPGTISSTMEPTLGFYGEEIEDQLAEFFRVQGERALLVTEVVSQGAAEAMDVKAGDVILRLGPHTVTNMTDLRVLVADRTKADTRGDIILTLSRQGTVIRHSITWQQLQKIHDR